MSDTTTGTFTPSGATYPAQFTKGKIVDPDGFPYQKGSVKFAALVEESQPKKKKIVGIKYDDGTVHGESFPIKIEQAEADIWLALNKTVTNDPMGCVSDPLNPDERELYTALTTKLKAISSMTYFTATESEQ